MSARPPFELEPYEDVSLDQNKMLTNFVDLVGHTFKAAIESPCGKHAEPGSLVLITETGCWAVLTIRGYSLEDAYFSLDQKQQTGGYRGEPVRNLTIHDFLSANELLSEGIISDAEYKLLRDKELAAERAEKIAKAERIRKELAELEGGAV